ncbi:MAG TPA: hypothetical protein PLB89_03410 [Flavobacteriales bacterium]|nr:hypothetical protein [Flavobacteriales bacterium]
MRTIASALLALASTLLSAQSTDTTEVRNGVFWIYGTGKDGRPKGEGVAYDTAGRSVGRETYRKGLTHGQLVWYDARGRVTWTVSYQKGIRQGIAIQYDSLGQKIHSINYRKGIKHGHEIYFRPSGRVHYDLENRNGQLHGTLKSYHPNGLIEWTGEFRDGEMHGERILRDSTGTLHNGGYMTTFPMGMGRSSVTCAQGRPHGESIMQRNDGSVTYRGRYENGRPDGEFLYYDRDGKVYRKSYFENGVFVRSTKRGTYGGHTPQPYEAPLPEER